MISVAPHWPAEVTLMQALLLLLVALSSTTQYSIDVAHQSPHPDFSKNTGVSAYFLSSEESRAEQLVSWSLTPEDLMTSPSGSPPQISAWSTGGCHGLPLIVYNDVQPSGQRRFSCSWIHIHGEKCWLFKQPPTRFVDMEVLMYWSSRLLDPIPKPELTRPPRKKTVQPSGSCNLCFKERYLIKNNSVQSQCSIVYTIFTLSRWADYTVLTKNQQSKGLYHWLIFACSSFSHCGLSCGKLWFWASLSAITIIR